MPWLVIMNYNQLNNQGGKKITHQILWWFGCGGIIEKGEYECPETHDEVWEQ